MFLCVAVINCYGKTLFSTLEKVNTVTDGKYLSLLTIDHDILSILYYLQIENVDIIENFATSEISKKAFAAFLLL